MGNNEHLVPLTSIDAFWLSLDEPTNLMVITGVMEFDEVLDYSSFCALIESKWLSFDSFRKRVVYPAASMGAPYWDEDPNFDIRNHITRGALPSPGDKATLQRMISDLTIIPLDKTKPLWQLHIIENYGKGCILFARIHHAIADGIALIQLLLGSASKEPDYSYANADNKYKSVAPMQTDDSSSSTEQLKLAMRATKSTVSTAVQTAGAVYDTFVKTIAYPSHLSELSKAYWKIGTESAAALGRLVLMPPDTKTSLKGNLGVQKNVCWSDSIPQTTVKEIGKYFKSTINDVLMAAIAGALRQYLLDEGNEIDDDTRLRVSIPVNIRPLTAKVVLGNQFSIVILALPVEIDNPVRRLRETRKRMRAIKESAEPLVGFQVMKVMGIPPTVITKLGMEFFTAKFSGVLSNVPGPREPMYFTDKKIRNMIFWVPRTGNTPMGISIISYAGSITIGLAIDARVCSNPERIIKCFNDELSQFIELAKSDVMSRFLDKHGKK